MQTVVKRMVCLANSWRGGERCVAGREWKNGEIGDWIRPIHSLQDGAVNKSERQYEGNVEPRVLDILDLSLQMPNPDTNFNEIDHQSENWLLDSSVKWKKFSRMKPDNLDALAKPEIPDLWIAGSSSRYGKNDKIPSDVGDELTRSIGVVQLERVKIVVPKYINRNPENKVRACFTYKGEEYKLSITDDEFMSRVKKKRDCEFTIPKCYATISVVKLSDNGDFYRLVAAIFAQSK